MLSPPTSTSLAKPRRKPGDKNDFVAVLSCQPPGHREMQKKTRVLGGERQMENSQLSPHSRSLPEKERGAAIKIILAKDISLNDGESHSRPSKSS